MTNRVEPVSCGTWPACAQLITFFRYDSCALRSSEHRSTFWTQTYRPLLPAQFTQKYTHSITGFFI